MIYFQALWLYFLYITLINSNLYPQERCDKDDCSLQLQPFQNESCFMHRTEVCLQSMANFTLEPDTKLESEEDAKFSGFISPYTGERVYHHRGFLNLPAINISFVIHKEGVDALAIKINKNICRIFDFRSSKTFLGSSVTFFYDCLYFPLNSQLQHVQMDMISLPSNEHLTYYVYIPDFNSIRNPCDWQPVIMVFCGKLVDGIVKIKFSQAPQQLKISSYTVDLVEKLSEKKMNLAVSSIQKTDMLIAEFVSVPYGNYTAIVKPSSMNCFGTKTAAFQVGNSKSRDDIIIVISIGIIILFIISSFAVYKFYILPKKLKGERRNSSKSFEEVKSEESSTRSSNEDNEDSGSIPFLSSSISYSDKEIEDLEDKYFNKFS